jgi:uncharacterized protein
VRRGAVAALAIAAACSALALAGAAAKREADELLAVPPLTGPVVDLAGALSPAGRRRIEALAVEVEQKTGAEIATLVVRSTAPEDPFGYGMRVAEAWKLGKKGKDDGLLLLVALDDRRTHLFTGYGLEGILPDGRAGAILDEHVVPAFRAGEYDRGVYAGLRAAAEVIADDAGVELGGEPVARRRGAQPGPDPALLVGLAILAFVVLAALAALAPPTPARRRRGGFAPIFWGGGLPQPRGRLGSGLGGGGGFGGGGFGGGFGGGGSFGGGGAGRGW